MIKRSNELFKQTEVIEQPISLSEYEALRSSIKDFESRIDTLNRTIEKDRKTIDSKDESLKEKDNTLTELAKQIDSLQASIASGAAYKDKAEAYETQIAEITFAREALQTELDAKKQEVQSVIESKQQELDEKQSQIDKYALNEKELQSKIDSLTKDLSSSNDAKESSSKEVLSAKLEINQLNAKVAANDKIVEDLNESLRELSKNLDDEKASHSSEVKHLMEEIGNLQIEKTNLETQVAQSDSKIALANQTSSSEQQKLKDEITSLKTQLNVKSEQLKSKETQYNDLVSKSGMDENGASALLDNYKSLESVTKSLREQLGSSQKDVETLQRKAQDAGSENSRLKAQVKQLNDSLKILAGSSSDSQAMQAMLNGTITVKPIRYNGQAQIIPVFGTGHGTTTFAMSLARKIVNTSSTVLYIDFDTVTPSADAWFTKQPYVAVPGVPPEARETALGVFFKYGLQAIEGGFNFQCQSKDKLIKAIDRVGRGGAYDYMSGVYNRVDQTKIANADYTGLFNFLGSKYQYIIIDFGRLGCNDAVDHLISAVTNIAVKSVIVTSNDMFEIRNARAKLDSKENKFNLNKISWLINYCENTNVPDVVKKMINPIMSGIMFFDASLFGKKQILTSTNNKMINDKFEQFVNYSIFK
jgi:hypothetical protein